MPLLQLTAHVHVDAGMSRSHVNRGKILPPNQPLFGEVTDLEYPGPVDTKQQCALVQGTG